MDKNMTVLVAEDILSARETVIHILRALGFSRFLEAENGAAALEHVSREIPGLIISDWNMPKMSGIELLRKVRASEEFGALPFLMVTAEAQQENIIEAVQAKVSNYIVKPFTPETLDQKIQKIFGK